MPKLVLALGLALGIGSAQTQPLGLRTSPQGTLTYALGASEQRNAVYYGNLERVRRGL